MRLSDRACALAAVVSIALLGSCSGEQNSAVEPGQSVTAASDCDIAAVTKAIEASYAQRSAEEGAGLQLQSASDIQCADGWAVAIVSIGDGQGHDFDDREALQLTAAGWQVADRMVACGAINPKKPGLVPGDAEVPASLWRIACQTD